MNRREQIIIGLAGLAAVYGLYEYVGKPLLAPEPIEEVLQVDMQAILSMSASMQTNPKLAKKVAIVLATYEKAWSPASIFPTTFSSKDAGYNKRSKEEFIPITQGDFVYSGYLLMNDDAIAIVNGIDYRQGELIEDYFLESILPEKIILSRDGLSYSLTLKESETE